MFACLVVIAARVDAAALSCAEGSPAAADLGDGVTMLTCLRESESGKAVRVGPVRLVRNGIVILSAQTNADGKLHGRYVARDDDGSVTEEGDYAHGLKIGKWLQVDPSGTVTTVHYRDGIPVEP